MNYMLSVIFKRVKHGDCHDEKDPNLLNDTPVTQTPEAIALHVRNLHNYLETSRNFVFTLPAQIVQLDFTPLLETIRTKKY